MLAADLDRFYATIDRLTESGRLYRLADCHGRMAWPRRGVYFFFEPGEVRLSGGPRVVRVGTHAVSEGSQTTLWNRLSQHRGTTQGLGNHRGSIFRLHVGGALLDRDNTLAPKPTTWGFKSSAPTPHARLGEQHIERAVSAYIGQMQFTWIAIDDPPSSLSHRRVIERNALGLLSAAHDATLESASPAWLGRACRSPEVRASGLWNIDCVSGQYEPSFLETLDRYASTGRVA